jgi:hypothetical protein
MFTGIETGNFLNLKLQESVEKVFFAPLETYNPQLLQQNSYTKENAKK